MNKKAEKPNKGKSKSAAAELGRLGGRAVAKKLGKNHMAEIGARGAEARWKNKKSKKSIK
jgi:general stress protein YciG